MKKKEETTWNDDYFFGRFSAKNTNMERTLREKVHTIDLVGKYPNGISITDFLTKEGMDWMESEFKKLTGLDNFGKIKTKNKRI